MDDAEACRRKMINATALIEGLSGERIRWTEASKGFEAQIHRLVGDSIQKSQIFFHLKINSESYSRI
jgi:dynein heavy chain